MPSLRFASATKVVISGDQSVHSATNASTYRTCSWNTFHATGCRRMSASTLRHFRYSRWSPCPARDVSTSDRRWLSADRHNQSLQPAHTATGPVRDLLSISIFSSCRDSVINVLDFHPANMGSCLAVTCIRQWNRIMPKLLPCTRKFPIYTSARSSLHIAGVQDVNKASYDHHINIKSLFNPYFSRVPCSID